MDAMKEESKQSYTLRLEGNLGIQSASELKKVLLEALSGANHLILNLEKVTGADVSGLQLLCALHRIAMSEGKGLAVIGGAAPSFRQVVRDAGFEREQGCSLDHNQSCLWKAGV